ncbi:hypothetical protein Hanom_Chr00s002531g01701241 [Helianthus anomalus]
MYINFIITHYLSHLIHPFLSPLIATIEIKLDEAAVLHYTYTKFSDLTSRRDRCGCKPTKDDVKRCFMLEFDRSAFIIASTATEEEMLSWYREHVVWTDKALNMKLMRKGILTRIHAPMVIIQGLRESGTFSSLIVSAQTTSSRAELLSSVTHDNTSSKVFQGKNDDKTTEAGLTGRKVLEVSDIVLSAVPPLSPPTINDDDDDI